MRISGCVIARNEEENIKQCLESLRTIADQIVVVDTGSTDRTVDFAQALGAEVHTFLWRDDFSAAKNFALQKAAGEWVVFLDADEYIPLSMAGHLKILLKRAKAHCDGFLTKMVNIDADHKNQVLDFFYTVRIFRRMKRIQYQGKIHEQITSLDKTPLRLERIDPEKVCLYHTGYSSGRIRKKCQRNLKILLDRLAVGESSSDIFRYIAEAYATMEEYDKVLPYARRAIQQPIEYTTYGSRFYQFYLVALKECGLADTEEFLQILQCAMTAYPELADFRAEYALYLFQQSCYAEAKKEMEQALSLHAHDKGEEPSFFGQNLDGVKKILALCEKHIGQTIVFSACLIVKNAEKDLQRWIDSLKSLADEWVVADTGSTDRTKEILAANQITAYEFPWQEDFSAAKNFVLEKARGKWIIFLDADEFLSRESISVIKKLAHRAEADAFLCQIINLDNQGKEMGHCYNIRVFRNCPEIRYIGRIHEGLEDQRGALNLKQLDGVQIFHLGYQPSRIKEKAKRNLALLLKEQAEKGENPKQYAYFCDAYYALGDYEETIRYAALHVEKGQKSLTGEAKIYRNWIAAMEQLHYPPEKIETICHKAILTFPQLPDFYGYLAEQLCKRKCWQGALEQIERAFELYEHPCGSLEVSSFAANLSPAYTICAMICNGLNESAQAMQFAKKALRIEKYNRKAFQIFYCNRSSLPVQQRLQDLQEFYEDSVEDTAYLKNEIERIQIDDVYFHYANQWAQKEFSRREEINRKEVLYQRQYNEAVDLAQVHLAKALQTYFFMLLDWNDWEKAAPYRKQLPLHLANLVTAYYGQPLKHAIDISLAHNLLVEAKVKLKPEAYAHYKTVFA